MSWAGIAALCVCIGLVTSTVQAEESQAGRGISLSHDATGIPESGKIEFAVYRKGDKIGRHTLTFTEEADELIVDVNVNLKVRLLFITVYRFEHKAKEVWNGGHLTSFVSETKQNGNEWYIDAACHSEKMIVNSNEGQHVVSESLFPSTYWNVASLDVSRWLNTQFGSPVDVNISAVGYETVTAIGKPMETLRYKVTGMIAETQRPVNLDLWYGDDGELMKLQFHAADGSLIEYRRTS